MSDWTARTLAWVALSLALGGIAGGFVLADQIEVLAARCDCAPASTPEAPEEEP